MISINKYTKSNLKKLSLQVKKRRENNNKNTYNFEKF